MPGTTTSSATAHAATPISALLTELRHADHIIKVMLNAMTLQQKERAHLQLDAVGVSGEGMTRANERRAVIKAASVSDRPHSVDVGAIRQHVSDISAHAARLEILLLTIFEKLDDIRPMDQAAVDAVECFATCALRNAVLIKEANADILVLASEGGAA